MGEVTCCKPGIPDIGDAPQMHAEGSSNDHVDIFDSEDGEAFQADLEKNSPVPIFNRVRTLTVN